MTAAAALELALQILGALPTVIPEALQAISELKGMIESGKTPTAEDIDALISRIKAQSATIQKL